MLKVFPVRSWLAGQRYNWRIHRAKQLVLRRDFGAPVKLQRTDWEESITDPSGFYLRCFQYFHRSLDTESRMHRAYFAKAHRGFGEEAFHTMWSLLVAEFRPIKFLEIGVYRGQVLSLVSLLQRRHGITGSVCGISPFLPVGDSVSRYRGGIDYQQDTLQNFRHFNLPAPILCKAYSTDPEARRFMASETWDLIYIDGNHDYPVVSSDWQAGSAHVKSGGLIVLDDSGLTTSYQAPAFATRGHPGPSRVALEIDRAAFREVLQVGHNRVFQKIAA